jgi:hypothetical protein
MGTCQNQVGVLNLTLAFTNCDANAGSGGANIAPRTHFMAKDQLPMYLVPPYTLVGTTQGRAKRQYANAKIKIDVSRDLSIPLGYYQGMAAVDYQCEHLSGAVVTGSSGYVIGAAESDGDTVTLNLEFAKLEELLPAGSLAQNNG